MLSGKKQNRTTKRNDASPPRPNRDQAVAGVKGPGHRRHGGAGRDAQERREVLAGHATRVERLETRVERGPGSPEI